jgi:hypothetical protein
VTAKPDPDAADAPRSGVCGCGEVGGDGGAGEEVRVLVEEESGRVLVDDCENWASVRISCSTSS